MTHNLIKKCHFKVAKNNFQRLDFDAFYNATIMVSLIAEQVVIIFVA